MRDQNSLIKLSYVSVKIQSLFVTWIEILLSRRHINRCKLGYVCLVLWTFSAHKLKYLS